MARSFSDQANDAIQTDVIGLIVGFFIVYIYVMVMIGGFGCVRQKVCKTNLRLIYLWPKIRGVFTFCTFLQLGIARHFFVCIL